MGQILQSFRSPNLPTIDLGAEPNKDDAEECELYAEWTTIYM